MISGYYGFNNTGDEAILKGIIDSIRKKRQDLDLLVLSKYPEFTEKKYGVASISRNNFAKIAKELNTTDVFLSGGGSLLQDVTSKKSIFYYLFLIKMAMKKSVKTMIFSQGIGPINSPISRFFAKRILNQVDVLNVRDQKSMDTLRKLGIKREILLTTDTVFGINKPDLEIGRQILKTYGLDLSKDSLGISILDWKDKGYRTLIEMTRAIKLFTQKRDVNIIINPLYYYKDMAISEELYKKIKSFHDKVFLIKDYGHINDYLSIIGNTKAFLSIRLHGLIFASLMGSYPIGISYDPKCDGFMMELERKNIQKIEDFDGALLARELEEAFLSKEANPDLMKDRLEVFYKKSEIHIDKLLELVDS